MRPRIFFKMWLLAMVFCGAFLGALSTSSSVPKSPEPTNGPVVPLKILDAEKTILNKKSGTELTPDPLTTLMVMATLDGTLTAVDRVSGELKWISKDEPMIRVPSGPLSTKAPYFLPDPKTGSLYVMGRSNSLKKLPFTIPQLVAMAPCRNSEGLMYTGKKLDYWLTLNPTTGEKSEMPVYAESTCPAKHEDDASGSCKASPEASLPGAVRKSLLIGKTEYTLSMLDGRRKWNITYHHYSSVDMSHQASQDYELVHFTSPSTGAVLTYDRESGQLLWQRELDSPVIAVYAVDCASSNLVSVPFNPIAPETLDRLKSVSSQSNQPLSPTTYIGESNYGLYAVPALVDEMVLLMSSDGTSQLPPLLEGPSADSNDTPQETKQPRGRGGSVTQNNISFDPQGTPERDILLLGYYELPEEPAGKLPMQIESATSSIVEPGPSKNSLPAGQYNDSDAETGFVPPAENYSTDKLELLDPVPLTDQVTPNKVQFPPFPMPQVTPMTPIIPEQPKPEGKFRDVKPIKIVFTTAVISVAVTSTVIIAGLILYRKYYAHRGHKRLTAVKEKASDTEEDTSPKRKPKKSSDGSIHSIGKISFNPSITLGKGCEGTFVFKGKFEDRDVAVKRILPQCFEFADREVDLLKTADQHPNVIRYFCTESDEQFRYIALELCEATLSDWVEGKFVCDSIDPIHILREATDGLAHLHALRIVHRDVKPANVLLMRSSSGNHVRTMISDFGLCKKISNDRMSFSRRSGGIPGTDGWIAPEVLRNMDKKPQRMSYSVDVFSLGCVYYFVLTGGDHPFGDTLRRQSNIHGGDYDVEKVRENPQGLYDLIRLMISTDVEARPPLLDVLCHPMFWSKEKMLQFFLDISDRIEKESETCLLLRQLESDGPRIVRDDWRDHICPEVAMDLRKYRTYNGQKIRDLLRALRNKKNHYRELTLEAQASLGDIPDQFADYWVTRFPDLLPYTYLKFETVRDEAIFLKYYPKSYSFNSNLNGDMEDGGGDNEEEGRQDFSTLDKSPNKLDKNFWRSKSQFKYNKWRRQQQNTNLRENPSNFTSFGTTRYPPQQQSQNHEAGRSDMDNSWRNPLPKNKP